MAADITLVIAIWGAVTGTAATVGGLIALFLDRSKLEASQRVEVSHHTPGKTQQPSASRGNGTLSAVI